MSAAPIIIYTHTDEAPALATEPVRASFCDGAAWADAALV